MSNWLLLPPLAFITLILVSYGLSFLFSALAIKNSVKNKDSLTPYACGENITQHRMSPDYKQFFSFAFFFTIMHVVALIVATIPRGSGKDTVIGVFYIFSAFIALFILYRR